MKKKQCPVDYGICENCIYSIDNSCKYLDPEYPDFCFECGKPTKRDINFCCKECEDKFKECARKEKEKEEEQLRKDTAVLEEAKKHLTKKQIEIMDDGIEDVGGKVYGFEIVDKPHGDKQVDARDYIEFVDQRSVGTEGDSFEGEVYVQLLNGKYLKYDYEC